ncbi:hypothetical protein U9M48_009184 [Paspalum notatum var. saurae]|uniref:K Homology domain-containing protein n=1 Tax=Paspalum notatum var. saurae TaxID=547442 RepID=A0AAQ3SR25_PASNO
MPETSIRLLVGMVKMRSSSKDKDVHKGAMKSNEKSFLKLGKVDDEDSDDVTSSAAENRFPGWPGTSVFRMLIPAHKVGAIIGHKGDRVKRLCEETKACVHIIGGHLCAAEQAVIIYGKEQPDEQLPPAVDALLRVYWQIVNDDALDVGSNSMIVTRILTPSEQAASLIGEHGAVINSIMKASETNIRVIDGDLPPVALEEDRVIEIRGVPAGVHKALELVASHLRKYLVDRSVIPLFEHHISSQVPMPVSRMDMSPYLYNDYPEGPVNSFSPGYHSICAEDLHCEPWVDTSYWRDRHPLGNLGHADTFGYRWEAPTSFRRYRSVTPPNHSISAYGPEASSPMEAYPSGPIELHSYHNRTYGWHASPVSSMDSVERVRSLISIYGQQAHSRRQTYQSAKMGKHPHLEISLHGSETHPTQASPSDSTEQPPTPSVSPCGRESSPCFRMHPLTTVENLLHCRVSACGPESPPHLVPPSSASRSTPVASQVKKRMQVPIFYAEAVIGPAGGRIEYIRRTSRSTILISDSEEDVNVMSIEITGKAATDVLTAEQLIKNFMAEAAAASPGHSFDFIPSYLPAPRSPQADFPASSGTSRS